MISDQESVVRRQDAIVEDFKGCLELGRSGRQYDQRPFSGNATTLRWPLTIGSSMAIPCPHAVGRQWCRARLRPARPRLRPSARAHAHRRCHPCSLERIGLVGANRSYRLLLSWTPHQLLFIRRSVSLNTLVLLRGAKWFSRTCPARSASRRRVSSSPACRTYHSPAAFRTPGSCPRRRPSPGMSAVRWYALCPSMSQGRCNCIRPGSVAPADRPIASNIGRLSGRKLPHSALLRDVRGRAPPAPAAADRSRATKAQDTDQHRQGDDRWNIAAERRHGTLRYSDAGASGTAVASLSAAASSKSDTDSSARRAGKLDCVCFS